VEDVVEAGGERARGSEVLDGVFFSSELGTTTSERSRRFDVDDVADDELHGTADDIRSRFGQQSVLTFDRLPAADEEVDAMELEVSGVSAQDLREGRSVGGDPYAQALARVRLSIRGSSLTSLLRLFAT
jgi:hypothetical protein